MIASILAPRPTFAVVLSSDLLDNVAHPGETIYNLNLDGVALLGTDAPTSTSIDDLVVKTCTGALITDQHVLSAAHCFDEDYDGQIDFLVRSFPFVAGFELPDGDVLRAARIAFGETSVTWTRKMICIRKGQFQCPTSLARPTTLTSI